MNPNAHLETPLRSDIGPGRHRRLRGSGGRPAWRARRRGTVPDAIRALKPFPGKAVPISDQERLARIEKARRLMAEHDIGAIVLETGTSMTYFANVRWGLSERPFLLVIPQKGELAYVCPGRGSRRGCVSATSRWWRSTASSGSASKTAST